MEKHSAPARIRPLRRGFSLGGFGRDCAVTGQPILQISFHHEAALAELYAREAPVTNEAIDRSPGNSRRLRSSSDAKRKRLGRDLGIALGGLSGVHVILPQLVAQRMPIIAMESHCATSQRGDFAPDLGAEIA